MSQVELRMNDTLEERANKALINLTRIFTFNIIEEVIKKDFEEIIKFEITMQAIGNIIISSLDRYVKKQSHYETLESFFNNMRELLENYKEDKGILIKETIKINNNPCSTQ